MASFTDQKPRIATEKDVSITWGFGKPGENFRCGFCGHKFAVGDQWRWQYTNNIPGAGGNPLVCASCDDEPAKLIEKWKKLHEEWREIISRFWWFAGRSWTWTTKPDGGSGETCCKHPKLGKGS